MHKTSGRAVTVSVIRRLDDGDALGRRAAAAVAGAVPGVGAFTWTTRAAPQ